VGSVDFFGDVSMHGELGERGITGFFAKCCVANSAFLRCFSSIQGSIGEFERGSDESRSNGTSGTIESEKTAIVGSDVAASGWEAIGAFEAANARADAR
jgi:hypothetical protein